LPRPANVTNGNSGTVEFTSYAPNRILLHAKAESASVLLLNDKYDPSWKVFVDGKPDKVLRCNFIMRGVALPAGDHQVAFRFEPRISGLYISIVSTGLCLVLLGIVVFASGSPSASPAAASTAPIGSVEKAASAKAIPKKAAA